VGACGPRARPVRRVKGHGNVGQVLDATNTGNITLAAHYEYDPYGNVIHSSGPYKDANPFRFSTKWFDEETSLGYWGYRYYSPRLGRWLSRDPIEERGGAHLYSFVANCPVTGLDPLGQRNWYTKMWCWCLQRAVAACVRGHTDTAWRNFTGMSGTRTDPITLSSSDMDEVLSEYDVRDEMIEPLIEECKASATGWATPKTTKKGLDAGNWSGYRYLYYYGDPSWGAALGGVTFTVESTCNASTKSLAWKASLRDEWDFDNWRSGVTQLPRNVIVLMVKGPNWLLDCGWKNFYHVGQKSGQD
ncbi:MAG: RHS repeat-associated core domain-containing protein, partial [Phycisphaerae bacterium]